MKILLAVDGSAYTKKMLAYLTTHLEVFSAKNEFTIFTVQMPLPPRAQGRRGRRRGQQLLRRRGRESHHARGQIPQAPQHRAQGGAQDRRRPASRSPRQANAGASSTW